jgi:hypothetical protein
VRHQRASPFANRPDDAFGVFKTDLDDPAWRVSILFFFNKLNAIFAMVPALA